MKVTLLALAAALGVAAAASDCPEACVQTYEPVCASNGMTFGNKCLLDKAVCEAGLSLTVVSEGACAKFCPDMCTQNFEPVCATTGDTFSNYCQLLQEACRTDSTTPVAVAHLGSCRPAEDAPCPEACAMDYRPVCATNGKTYSNLCEMEREACLQKTPLAMAHAGECAEEGRPENCPEFCIEEFRPVCGTNGRTYSNLCFLQREACLAKGPAVTLRVASEGECSKVCPDFCAENYEPVCGSDGVTYSNLCGLLRAACNKAETLAVTNSGPCLRAPTCPEMCTKEYNPVCGSDGVTYSNPCVLQREACTTRRSISISHLGTCMDCPEVCTSQHSPLCASNGRTYSNRCFLQLDACRVKSPLSVLHEGDCEERECAEFCASDYSPVCGTDGKTYGNLCSLNRASCLSKSPNLVIARLGECDNGQEDGGEQDGGEEPCPEVCPMLYMPVCGSDWKTYSNLCSLKAAACRLKTPLTVMGNSECENVGCNMKCTKEFRPVCGSDGLTYSNECMMSLASCEKRRLLTKLHDGSCTAADCDLMCPEVYEPVCATGHTTFSNLCKLDAANCNSALASAQVAAVAHEGECTDVQEGTTLTWAILREFDASNDQLISLDEFLAAATLAYPHYSKALLEKVFKSLDSNSDGQLDVEEAKALDGDSTHVGVQQQEEDRKSSSVAVAAAASVLGLVVVAVAVLAFMAYRKKKGSSVSFAPLDESGEQVEETPYRPMEA